MAKLTRAQLAAIYASGKLPRNKPGVKRLGRKHVGPKPVERLGSRKKWGKKTQLPETAGLLRPRDLPEVVPATPHNIWQRRRLTESPLRSHKTRYKPERYKAATTKKARRHPKRRHGVVLKGGGDLWA